MRLTVTAAVVVAAALGASAEVAKPAVKWDSSPNYTSSSRESSYNIDAIVIHTTEGTYSGAISWFNNSSAGVSAHYVISPTGEITQMVADDDIAWHATYYNNRSIGIECAGYASKSSTWTPALLESLTKLTAWLCQEYDVPAVHPSGDAYDEPGDKFTKTGLVAHGQIQPWNRTDPGVYFPWTSFVSEVNALLEPPPVPPAPIGLAPDAGMPVSSPATLTWDPMTSFGVDTYWVVVEQWSGSSWTWVTESYPTSASASFSWSGEGDYRFAVWAHTASGWGPGSDYAYFHGLPPPPTPPAPTGLSPTGSVSKWGPSVKLTWGALAGADKYEVYVQYYSKTTGTYKYYYKWTATSATFTFWPTVTYTYYRWWVRGHNSSGWGPWSGGGSPTSGTGSAKFYFNK